MRKLLIFPALLAIFTLGCSAQSPAANDPALHRRIELQVRAQYNLPSMVKVEIGEKKPSEFAGYDLVPITLSAGERKSTHEFLLAKDGKTLVSFNKMDLSLDPMAKIDVTGRPVLGNPNAKVTIVNYDDFQCPYCSRMHTTLMQSVLKTYGDKVKLIYKDYPLEAIHPWAVRAAVNANCLGALNGKAYWDFADYAHNEQQAINAAGKTGPNAAANLLDQKALELGKKHGVDAAQLQACVKAQDESQVRASMKEGGEVGVEATPTLFVNGERIPGAIPEADLRQVIDRALVAAGEKPPAAPAAPSPAAGTPRQ